MGVPKHYRKVPEQQITSYNWEDIAAGVGYSLFYPTASQSSSALTYAVTQSTSIPSGVVVNKKSGSGTITGTYDILFNSPRRIKGKVYLSFSLGTTDGNQTTGTGRVTASLYHDDGAETQLGSTIESETVSASADTIKTKAIVLIFDLSSQIYKFKKGETLRLKVILTHTGASTATSGYSQDPSSSADNTDDGLVVINTGYTTRMTLAVPFILDL